MPEIFGAALMGGGSGPAFAAIGAIYPVGAVCTCSYNGQTLTAKDTSGRALFLVPSAGQWLVKATNGGQEVEDTVSITTQGQVASVTLAFFSATIVCTFPVDCTAVTCTKDSTVLSVPSGSLSSGSYTFAIPETGEWTLYATNGTKEKTVTVTVSEETAYTVTLSFELYIFKSGDGMTSGYSARFAAYISGGSASNSISTTAITWASNAAHGGNMVISPAVDLSSYSTLHVELDYTEHYDGGRVTFGVGNSTMGSSFTASKADTYNTSKHIITIDVSKITSQLYIKSTSKQSAGRFYNIWLT